MKVFIPTDWEKKEDKPKSLAEISKENDFKAWLQEEILNKK